MIGIRRHGIYFIVSKFESYQATVGPSVNDGFLVEVVQASMM
jgi:hypothetical protein